MAWNFMQKHRIKFQLGLVIIFLIIFVTIFFGAPVAPASVKPDKTVLRSELAEKGWYPADANALGKQIEGFYKKAAYIYEKSGNLRKAAVNFEKWFLTNADASVGYHNVTQLDHDLYRSVELYVKINEIDRAYQLLLKHNKFEKAADLALKIGKLEDAAKLFEKAQLPLKAAELYEKINRPRKQNPGSTLTRSPSAKSLNIKPAANAIHLRLWPVSKEQTWLQVRFRQLKI